MPSAWACSTRLIWLPAPLARSAKMRRAVRPGPTARTRSLQTEAGELMPMRGFPVETTARMLRWPAGAARAGATSPVPATVEPTRPAPAAPPTKRSMPRREMVSMKSDDLPVFRRRATAAGVPGGGRRARAPQGDGTRWSRADSGTSVAIAPRLSHGRLGQAPGRPGRRCSCVPPRGRSQVRVCSCRSPPPRSSWDRPPTRGGCYGLRAHPAIGGRPSQPEELGREAPSPCRGRPGHAGGAADPAGPQPPRLSCWRR